MSIVLFFGINVMAEKDQIPGMKWDEPNLLLPFVTLAVPFLSFPFALWFIRGLRAGPEFGKESENA